MQNLIDTPYGKKSPAMLCRAMDALEARPVAITALEELLAPFALMVKQLPPEQQRDAEMRITNAKLALANAKVATGNVMAQPVRLNEVAQVVVFASGGVTHSVAIRDLPVGDVPCIVVDYDDRHGDSGDMSPEDFERKKIGCTREEFDATATYIW